MFIRFCLALLVAFVETGAIFFVLYNRFGHAALKQQIMCVLGGLVLLGLLGKGFAQTVPLQWAAINFILFFLLSATYRGDLKQQAILAALVAAGATGLDAAVKLCVLPVI